MGAGSKPAASLLARSATAVHPDDLMIWPSQGNLFANDFLEDAITGLPDWETWDRDALAKLEISVRQALDEFPTDVDPKSTPNETVTEQDLIWPILEALGWTASLRAQNMSRRGREDVPDGVLFMDADTKKRAHQLPHDWQRYGLASALVESKRWNRPLDRNSTKPGESDTPSTQMLRYLRRADDLTQGKLRWGILTNGAIWRLYDYRAHSVADHFFEFDVRELWGHGSPMFMDTQPPEDSLRELKLFATMFGRSSFLTDPASGQTFHQKALQESENYRARITESLSNTIFETAYPRLARAIAEQCPDDPLPQIRDASLVFLYRLLFLLYAEDRNLLPIQDHRYSHYAIRDKVRRNIGERKDGNQTFSTTASHYWSIIQELCNCIDVGDPSIGLPPYNGGLFDRSRSPILERIRLNDAVIADIVDVLSFDHRAGLRRYVNFRDLGVQHLGSVYEGLLEQELVPEGNTLAVRPNTFARKRTGSYYTPDSLVALIIRETIGPLIDAREGAFADACAQGRSPDELARLDPAERILDLRVLDPAMGSGHFLVNLVDYLADRTIAALADADMVEGYVSPLAARIEELRATILRNAQQNDWRLDRSRLDDRHIIRRMILKRCVFGVDKNPMAVELAKVALWLHTFTVGAPLSFLDHHLRCGNSLFGSWIHNADPFSRSGIDNILFQGPINDAIEAEPVVRAIENLTDVEIEEAHQSAARFDQAQALTRPLNALLSFFCALRWLRAQGRITAHQIAPLLDGTLGDLIAIALSEQNLPSDHELAPVVQDARALMELETFFHWQAAFPGIWTDWGAGKPRGGFDAVIGNPPWDRIKVQKAEWFETRRASIARALRGADRRRKIRDIAEENDPLAVEFSKAEAHARGAAEMARKCGDYPFLSKGDIDLYKLFVERSLQLLAPTGNVGVLVPSGIASDKYAAPFFRSIATSSRLRALYDFENRRTRYELPPFFGDVHSSQKFCAFVASASRKDRPARCGFFLQDIAEITDSDRSFELSAGDFARFNPNTGTAPVFRNQHDADITKSIYANFPIFVDKSTKPASRQWPVKYIQMFHMDADSHRFHTREELKDRFRAYPARHGTFRDRSGTWFPLYEGKMVQAFDHRAADIVVNPKNVKRPKQPNRLEDVSKHDPSRFAVPHHYVHIARKDIAQWQNLNRWNLAFKDATATTNSRTMIAAIVPAAATADTLPVLQLFRDHPDPAQTAACILGNLNSLVFDFVARQKVPTTHFKLFVLEQLPVIPLPTYASVRFGPKTALELVREIVLELSYTAHDLKAFAQDIGYVNGRGIARPPFRWNCVRRGQLLSKLDALYFWLYGITDPEEVRHVFSTFPNLRRANARTSPVQPSLEACLAWINALAQGAPDADIGNSQINSS